MTSANLDPQSPPASPGLVLETEVPATNEHIDHFALDGLEASNKAMVRRQRKSKGARRRLMMIEDDEGDIKDVDNVLNNGESALYEADDVKEDNDDDFPLTLNVSSDSYFSHHRGSFNDILNTPQSANRYRRRRVSDISDTGSAKSFRSGGTSNGSESDYYNDYNFTPTSSRRSSGRPGRRSGLMSLEEESASSSRVGSRSSSRSRPRSKSSTRILRDGKDYMQPTQIFRGLFVMEQSLCAQYIHQTRLRYKYLVFLILMFLSLAICAWGSFMSAHDSVWWIKYFKFLCQIGTIIVSITLMLFYLSGMYQKTISRPRQFLTSTNRGLRQFNIKLVKVRFSIYERILKTNKGIYYWLLLILRSVLHFLHCWLHLVPLSWVQTALRYETGVRYERNRDAIREVKIMLNPRAFNGSTRDQWEVYRRQQGLLERTRRPARAIRQS